MKRYLNLHQRNVEKTYLSFQKLSLIYVFEIWNIDEYRINAGLFDGLNVPFKPQSPHRLYPNYLIDKTTLLEDEAWKLLKEMEIWLETVQY